MKNKKSKKERVSNTDISNRNMRNKIKRFKCINIFEGQSKMRVIGIIGRKVLLITSFFLLVFCFCSRRVKAEGGTFYHHHDESCYETTYVPCTEHRTQIETTYGVKHCPYCNLMTDTVIYHTFAYCPTLDRMIEEYYVGLCAVCSNVLYSHNVESFEPHEKPLTELVCGKTTETPMATVTFARSTTQPTVGFITLSVQLQILDDTFQIGENPYSFDGGNTWEMTCEKRITGNGTYTVCCRDTYGTMFSETFVVDNILIPTPVPAVIDSGSGGGSETLNENVIQEETDFNEHTPTEESTLSETHSTKKSVTQKSSITPRLEKAESFVTHNPSDFFYAPTPKPFLVKKETITVTNNEIHKENEEKVEGTIVMFKLAPYVVKIILGIGIGLLASALWLLSVYLYKNMIFVYELENEDRFFSTILFLRENKEKSATLSNKKIEKIASKKLLLKCNAKPSKRTKSETFVLFYGTEMIRTKWKKEMVIEL